MSSPNSAEVSGSPSPAPSSIGNNAPKYGTLVPNRIFVGGISASTSEQDLLELFSQYGTVKATKIISDRAGVSKGYGFVTFETEDEARRLTQEADNIMLKDRKLNIAPAIKKQVSDVGYIKTYSPRLVETNNSMVGAGGTVFFSNGATYSTYGSTVPVIGPAEYHPTFTQAPAAPPPPAPTAYQTIVYQQPMYYTQQYQYPPTQTVQAQWGAAPQWRWVAPASYPQQASGSYITSDGMYTQASPTYIPECTSQCLVEPSSLPHKDPTTLAVGNLPYTHTSTCHVLTTPSASTTTSSIATATVSTTNSTSPRATVSTATSSSNTFSPTATTVCDSILLIKPLQMNGKTKSAIGKPKSPARIASKTIKAVDNNNHSTKASESKLNKSFILRNNLSRFNLGKSSSTTDKETGETSDVVENKTNKEMSVNTDSIGHKTGNLQKAYETERMDGTSCDKRLSSLRPPLHGNSSHDSQNFIRNVDISENMNTLTFDGRSVGNTDMHSRLRRASSCPQHGSEGLLTQSTLGTQQTPSFILVPSLTSPVHARISKNTVPHKSESVVKYSATNQSPSIQMQCISNSTSHWLPVSTEAHTGPRVSAVTHSPIATNSFNNSLSITTQVSLVSATKTVTSNTRSICSPINNHSTFMYGHNMYCASHPGFELNQSHGYASQNVWMMMLPYTSWRTGAPCYQWPAPVYVQWPVAPSPLIYAPAASVNANSPTHSVTPSLSSISSDTLSPDLHYNSYDSESRVLEDVYSRPSQFRQSDHRAPAARVDEAVTVTSEAQTFETTVSSAPCQRSKNGEMFSQKKQRGFKLPKSNTYNSNWSPASKTVSFLKKPDSFTYYQPARRMRNIGAITEAEDDERPSPHLDNDSSGLMPITPPPTPIFKTDSSATIVNDTNSC
ncbi:hypothetical protein SK128_019211 [Halocaridina rubra]|uniref:RRM domain-containing protein n=1 Tax=Halocaridina rubra TaxID=373956 RepID=A0AAN8XJ10_HALRR